MAVPKYRQIAEDLRKRIESGELAPGSQLPTEIELREQHQNASRNTVRDAIKWLTVRGLVRTQAGLGTFVLDKITPLVVDLTPNLEDSDVRGLGEVAYASEELARSPRSAGRKPESSVPRVEIQGARGKMSAALRLEEGADVVSRHQQRFIDGKPYSLQTTFYPIRFVEHGATRLIQAQDITEGAVRYLERLLGFREVGYEDRILARQPDESETQFFGLGAHVLIMETDRVTYDDEDRPVRFTVTVYPSDRHEFVIRAGEPPQEAAY